MILAAMAFSAFLATSPRAAASTFTFNFCPGNVSCNADLSEASLTFTSVDGTADVNDYTLTVKFVGTLTNVFIDSIDFTVGIALASLPVMTSAPSGTVLGDWTTQFDKISNGASNCVGGGASQLFACSKATTGNGPDFAGTNTWVYSIDFAGTGVVSANSSVDFRALFVDANGDKVGAVMSPVGNVVTTTTTVTPTTDTTPTSGSVPEPAMMSLLGLGLALSARQLRRSGRKN
jgi:hypothetical protein